MKLFEFKVTESSEPTRVYVAAGTVKDAIEAMEDNDLGEVDWESLQPYIDGERRPRVIKELDDIPDDFHDSVYLGENDREQTVAQLLD